MCLPLFRHVLASSSSARLGFPNHRFVNFATMARIYRHTYLLNDIHVCVYNMYMHSTVCNVHIHLSLLCVNTCVCIYVYISLALSVSLSLSIYIYSVSLSLSIYLFVYLYIYIYMYTHICASYACVTWAVRYFLFDRYMLTRLQKRPLIWKSVHLQRCHRRPCHSRR